MKMPMLKLKLSPEELQKQREEAERKARRGEIEPTHDFTFSLIGQFTGLTKHNILEYIFEDPTILDELDHLYKSDQSKKLLFYFQPDEPEPSKFDSNKLSIKHVPQNEEEAFLGYKDRPRKIFFLNLIHYFQLNFS